MTYANINQQMHLDGVRLRVIITATFQPRRTIGKFSFSPGLESPFLVPFLSSSGHVSAMLPSPLRMAHTLRLTRTMDSAASSQRHIIQLHSPSSVSFCSPFPFWATTSRSTIPLVCPSSYLVTTSMPCLDTSGHFSLSL
jgi:hypothetical protein